MVKKFDHIPEKYVRTKSDRAFVDAGGQWEPERGERVRRFVERFCVPTRGFAADRAVSLLAWQWEDVLLPLFSWVKPDGCRRYREGCIYVPRQNGKSFMGSAIGQYMAFADKEPGAYVLLSGVSGDQTKVVFDEISNSIKHHPELAECCVMRESLREIFIPKTNSTIKGLSNSGWTKLGRPPHCFIGDEFAFWGDYKPYVAIKTGAGSRKQPLLLTISTSGTDRTTPAYEQWQYAEAVLSGGVVDPTFFPLIYTASDDIHSESAWRKANPSIGYSLDTEEIRTWSERAKRSKIEELQFRQFRLNQWCSSVNQFLNLDSWAACATTLPDLTGEDAFIFIDHSTTVDITGVVALISKDGLVFIDHHAFCCAEGVKRREAQNLVRYSLFEAEGTLTVHDGNTVDLEDVRNHVRNLCRKYNVRAIGIDPAHNANDTLLILTQEGYPIEPVPTNAIYCNTPMRRFGEMVLDGKIRHPGDSLINWQAQNLESKADSRNLIRPVKPSEDAKIDSMVCVIGALGLLIRTHAEDTAPKAGAIEFW